MVVKTKDKPKTKRQLAEEAKTQAAPEAVADAKEVLPPETNVIEWNRKQRKVDLKRKTACIVIDRREKWHQGVGVALGDRDTSEFTWGYYGSYFPVLVEGQDGHLYPFTAKDAVGESPNRLYKAANPDGYRSVFKHRNDFMKKIQLGLMIVLVFILIIAMVMFSGGN